MVGWLLTGCHRRGDGQGVITTLVDKYGPGMRANRARVAELQGKLAGLANFPEHQQNVRIGYHSAPEPLGVGLGRPSTRSITVDLRSVQRIDAVVLVPAFYGMGGARSEGYGFPRGFRVEVSEKVDFTSPTILLDHGADYLPNPQRYPVVAMARGMRTRYVRVVVTKPTMRDGYEVLALGELMVMQGERNLVSGLGSNVVRVTDSEEDAPTWSIRGLNDGQSILGCPEGPEVAPTEGWRSREAARSDEPRWVMLDLGREMVVDELRFIPVRSGQHPTQRGLGFPKRYLVETSLREDFSDKRVLVDRTSRDSVMPYDNPVVVRVRYSCRYIKVTATRLGEFLEKFVLAFAEIQVFSGDKNVALGARVLASDSDETGIWSPRFLTDGYSSQRELIPWLTYFGQLLFRQRIDMEVAMLNGERRDMAETFVNAALITCLGVAFFALVGSVVVAVRNAKKRRAEVRALQRQLAQDLHDEIGSGLGTISLLSQLGSMHPDLVPQGKEDFEEVQRLSRQVTESLRDIVWFNRSATDTVGDLALRLRETTASMLAGVDHEFTAEEGASRRVLDTAQKRHLLLYVKEALHNLQRHSGATEASVRLDGDAEMLRVTITDNGKGFDASVERSGAGLVGMAQRAKTMGGTFTVRSGVGEGTTLVFSIPWVKDRVGALGRLWRGAGRVGGALLGGLRRRGGYLGVSGKVGGAGIRRD